MNPKRQKKLIGILCFVLLIAAAIGLILFALKQNINLFYTPSELLTADSHERVRIGGYVKKQSVHFDEKGGFVQFVVTDFSNDIAVEYHGLLPNLFREGQGVVITGKLTKNIFKASEVLAKHDEKYLPKSIADEIASKRGKINVT